MFTTSQTYRRRNLKIVDWTVPTMEVERLESTRLGEVGALLARAFDSDPMCQYLCPNPATRHRQLAWMFERWSRVLVPLGASFVSKNGKGVAMWFPPGKGPRISLWAYFMAGFGAAPFRLGLGGIRRAAVLQADMERRWTADLKEPCWTLDVLGVEPSCRGQGIAASLLRPVLDRADAEHMPCYVITHGQANIAYYERYGFRLLYRADEGHLASSLWRPPRTTQTAT